MDGQKLTTLEEVDLLNAAKTEREAFGRFYDYFAPQIFRYINLKVNFDKTLSEDLTEEVFLKILENIKDIKGDRKKGVKPYLFTVARNTVFDYFRSSKRTVLSIERENIDPIDEKPPMEEEIIKEEEEKYLKKALLTISGEEKEILSLRFSSDLKCKEIAEIVNQSEGNISVIIHRTLEKLRIHLENPPERSLFERQNTPPSAGIDAARKP